MKTRIFVSSVVFFAGLVGQSFAVELTGAMRAPSVISTISCDVRDVQDEDKQGLCARKCDDDFIKNKENYNADLAKVKADKKACDEKCGCPQNSK
jgi:hypothetical protein